MTDVAAPIGGAAPGKPAFRSRISEARLRKRYRAEARLRLYGILALLVTGSFLIAVLASVMWQGMPAFRQNVLIADVPLPASEIDPAGTRELAVIRAADYAKIARAVLQAEFPGVTARADRKRLNGLLSTGAGDVLRDAVTADSALIGRRTRAGLILSDDVDLYLKGNGTSVVERITYGNAVPSGTEGEITMLTSANDFAPDLVAIKRQLALKAQRLRAEADRLAYSEDAAIKAKVDEFRTEAAGLQARFDSVRSEEPLDGSMPSLLARINGGLVKVTTIHNSRIDGQVLIPLQSTAEAAPGTWQVVSYPVAEANRKLADQEVAWVEQLRAKRAIESRFNWQFFTNGDSREPELAGIKGAIIGSALTLLVTIAICLPLGVMAAIYLEEFAPKNWLTDLIEININNLAAVPSIVFGLLGLAVFLNFFGMPRSAPLVGGLVLALLVLPTIIIAGRAALKSVPPSIKQAALSVGASHQQAIWHHVLPLAMPGIMTGAIIGMAHALGETAPLLMIGMVAFIVDVPQSFTDAASVLPVQIYLWSDLPEPAFQAKTAAAIMVLLVFLFLMNGFAIFLRKRFETKW